MTVIEDTALFTAVWIISSVVFFAVWMLILGIFALVERLLRVRRARRDTAARCICAVQAEADASIARLHAAYWQAQREIRRVGGRHDR